MGTELPGDRLSGRAAFCDEEYVWRAEPCEQVEVWRNRLGAAGK